VWKLVTIYQSSYMQVGSWTLQFVTCSSIQGKDLDFNRCEIRLLHQMLRNVRFISSHSLILQKQKFIKLLVPYRFRLSILLRSYCCGRQPNEYQVFQVPESSANLIKLLPNFIETIHNTGIFILDCIKQQKEKVKIVQASGWRMRTF